MIRTEIRSTAPLLILFFFLQMTGQITARFAGGMGEIVNPFTAISYVILISRGVVWLFILKTVPLTAAYPLTGLIYLLILPVSSLIFDEDVSIFKIAGALLIFSGIILSVSGAANED